jgi:hypothetical protein
MQEFFSNRADARHIADKQTVDVFTRQSRLLAAEILKTIDAVRRGETIKELAA